MQRWRWRHSRAGDPQKEGSARRGRGTAHRQPQTPARPGPHLTRGRKWRCSGLRSQKPCARVVRVGQVGGWVGESPGVQAREPTHPTNPRPITPTPKACAAPPPPPTRPHDRPPGCSFTPPVCWGHTQPSLANTHTLAHTQPHTTCTPQAPPRLHTHLQDVGREVLASELHLLSAAAPSTCAACGRLLLTPLPGPCLSARPPHRPRLLLLLLLPHPLLLPLPLPLLLGVGVGVGVRPQ